MTDPEVCHFQPGQLVECVSAFDPQGKCVDLLGRPANPLSAPPVKGCVYTIASLDEGPFGGFYLTLAELGAAMSYLWRHFRVVETPSIDCFHSLLAPSPTSPREVEPA